MRSWISSYFSRPMIWLWRTKNKAFNKRSDKISRDLESNFWNLDSCKFHLCVPVTKSNFPVFYEQRRSEVKSEGAENKIGHSIFASPALPPPPISNSNKRRPLSVFKTPTTFQLDLSDAILNGAENKKLYRITFHRGVGRVGGGSADQCGKKNEKS